MKDRLEPAYADAFHAHRKAPTPATAGGLLRAMTPVIDLGVKTYGGGDSPLVRSRARRLVLDAIPAYDPQQSGLKTFLMNRMQGLRRYADQLEQPLSVPERVLLDRKKLYHATVDLRDSLGRDPSDGELADHIAMPLKRIHHVRRFRPGVTEGEAAATFAGDDGEMDAFEPAVVGPDRTKAYAQFLLPDLHGADALILEHTLGLNGAERLPARAIARKANLTPAAISQRAKALQARLDELMDAGIL